MAFKEDDDINIRYEALKRRLDQQTAARKQQAGEGLARKFAAMGTFGSGEQMKLEQQAAQQIDEQSQQASTDIESQRIGEQQKRKMIEEERGWQSGEAEKQRGFAREEGEKGRLFAKGEREESQKFAAGEAATARDMQQRMFDADMSFKQKMSDLQDRQWSQDYKLREDEQAYNKAMADRMMNRKGLLDRMSNPTDQFWNPVSRWGGSKVEKSVGIDSSEWRF